MFITDTEYRILLQCISREEKFIKSDSSYDNVDMSILFKTLNTLRDKLSILQLGHWVKMSSKRKPKDGEQVLIKTEGLELGTFEYSICFYSNDLFKVDNKTFKNHKGVPGFYGKEIGIGYFLYTDVKSWMSIPKED